MLIEVDKYEMEWGRDTERRAGNSEAATKTQDEMEGRFLLDVVVAQSAAIFELFA